MNFGLKPTKPAAKAEAVPTISEQDFERLVAERHAYLEEDLET